MPASRIGYLPCRDRGSSGPKAVGKSAEPVDTDGVTVYRFPLTFASTGVADYLVEHFSAFKALARSSWRVRRRAGFNIIHFCNPPDIFFPIAITYRLLGARVVLDHHDLFFESVAWRYRGCLASYCMSWLE